MNEIERLAQKIHALEDRIGARNATQLDSSTIDVGASDSLVVSDVMADAAEATAVTLPGLQEALELNEARLQDNAEAVQVALDAVDAALDAADAAEAAGIAAGEEASAAAADALEKAQEALDAAAAAGGGATYSGTAPTASTAGVPGQQWFVWDSNYKINAYYVYDGATSTWVQTEITDAVLGNISAGSITSGYLGAERIAAASLTAAVLAADTITSREIAADAILARNIKAAEITGDKIAAATIAAGNIVGKTITAGQIAAGTITAGEIKAGTITANEIAAGTITAEKIAAGTITATEINLDSLNGKTITGATIRSKASGQRVELLNTKLDFYSPAGANVARLTGGSSGFLTVSSPSSANPGENELSIDKNTIMFQGTDRATGQWHEGFVAMTANAAGNDILRLTKTRTGGPASVVSIGDKEVGSSYTAGGYWDISAGDVTFTTAEILDIHAYNTDSYFGYTGGPAVTTSSDTSPVFRTNSGTFSALANGRVTATDYRRADGSSLATADYLQVSPTAAVPVNGTTDVTSRFTQAVAGGRMTTAAWSASGDGFTVPAGMGGLWQLSLAIRSVAGGQAFFQLNGTYVAFQDGTNATLNALIPLAAGDKVRLFMYSTSSTNSAQAATRFTALRLGS
ncbi:hypothetical protein [Curtobacterium flaccumfaciens]|uniref:hypothetical protein n=1 Tax=Curtobacterium flaccumfaciens TaxID=2035 RepID=UPI00387A1576